MTSPWLTLLSTSRRNNLVLKVRPGEELGTVDLCTTVPGSEPALAEVTLSVEGVAVLRALLPPPPATQTVYLVCSNGDPFTVPIKSLRVAADHLTYVSQRYTTPNLSIISRELPVNPSLLNQGD